MRELAICPKISVEKPAEKIPFGSATFSWEDNTKIHLKEVGRGLGSAS
jgi:hypothetical protein